MYFYLEWIYKRPTFCELIDKKPEKYTFQTSIKLRGFGDEREDLEIYGLINTKFEDYKKHPSPYKKRSYLISHLQKSIRKMKTMKSIQTAKHLIDLDINCLLRRLPIIMLEDVIPHSSLSILIWLMISISKGFQMKKIMIQWLL